MKNIIFLLIFLSTNCFSENLKLETSNRYLEVIGARENITSASETILTPLMDGLLRGTAQNARAKGFSEKQVMSGVNAVRPHLLEIKNALLSSINTLMPYKRLQEEVYYPALSESFNDEELNEIINFLSTPIGKKYSRESAGIFKRAASSSQNLFGADIEKYFRSELQKRKEQVLIDVQAALDNANK